MRRTGRSCGSIPRRPRPTAPPTTRPRGRAPAPRSGGQAQRCAASGLDGQRDPAATCRDPQIGQTAIPVAGSTSRSVAQPFVRQNGRSVAAWAAVARRRSRRMELARPAYVAAAERDIIRVVFSSLSALPAVRAWAVPLFIRYTTPVYGGGAVGGQGRHAAGSVRSRGARPGPSLRTGYGHKHTRRVPLASLHRFRVPCVAMNVAALQLTLRRSCPRTRPVSHRSSPSPPSPAGGANSTRIVSNESSSSASPTSASSRSSWTVT